MTLIESLRFRADENLADQGVRDDPRALALITHQRAMVREAAMASHVDVEAAYAAVVRLGQLALQARDLRRAEHAFDAATQLLAIREKGQRIDASAVRAILDQACAD